MRIAIGIEYQGSDYCGWQAQNGLSTIQTNIESALSKVANHPIVVTCAGRTDAGVHALNQVGHFDTHVVREDYAWMMGANSNLPADIRVLWVASVDDNFHARYTATARRYKYIIYNQAIRPAILRNHVSWYRWPLDVERMQEGAQHLIGEHDFSAYRGVYCQAKSTIRHVEYIKLIRKDSFIVLDIKANAFLHHMVRNIVGVLLEIGNGKREPIWAKEVLTSGSRAAGGITAPSQGLYLVEVDYPLPYEFPSAPDFPLLSG